MANRPHHAIAPRVVDRSRRVILPEEVMEALHLQPGDHVGFIIDGGKVTLAKAKWQLQG